MSIFLGTDVGEVHGIGRRFVAADVCPGIAVHIVLFRTTTVVGHLVHGFRDAEAEANAGDFSSLGTGTQAGIHADDAVVADFVGNAVVVSGRQCIGD